MNVPDIWMKLSGDGGDDSAVNDSAAADEIDYDYIEECIREIINASDKDGSMLAIDEKLKACVSYHEDELYRSLCRTQLRGRRRFDKYAKVIVNISTQYCVGTVKDTTLDDVLRVIISDAYDAYSVSPDKLMDDDTMRRLWIDLRYIIRSWVMRVKARSAENPLL